MINSEGRYTRTFNFRLPEHQFKYVKEQGDPSQFLRNLIETAQVVAHEST